MKITLILGSGPTVTEARDWDRGAISTILAVNNAWRVRPDWNELIYPEDFPEDRLPQAHRADQKLVPDTDFVPAMNAYGGMIYVGGTMAFNAGYWALHTHQPDVIAFFGCDMVYSETGKTHFYGQGSPDPLREDITLQSLEAKSARLMMMAARQNCAVVNLSEHQSRLVFPRAHLDELPALRPGKLDDYLVEQAMRHEALLGYSAPNGRYWEIAHLLNPKALRHIDHLWLRAGAAVDPTSAVA